MSKMGRNLSKMGRNLCGTKSVKNGTKSVKDGTKSVWDEICQNSTWDDICLGRNLPHSFQITYQIIERSTRFHSLVTKHEEVNFSENRDIF